MTQLQLNRAVAGATGESLRTVRGRGFGLLVEDPGTPRADELALVVDCPFCRHPVALATGPGACQSTTRSRRRLGENRSIVSVAVMAGSLI